MGNPLPGVVGSVRPFDAISSMCRGFADKAPSIVKSGSKTLAEDVVQLSNKAVEAAPGTKLTMKKLVELANKLIK